MLKSLVKDVYTCYIPGSSAEAELGTYEGVNVKLVTGISRPGVSAPNRGPVLFGDIRFISYFWADH